LFGILFLCAARALEMEVHALIWTCPNNAKKNAHWHISSDASRRFIIRSDLDQFAFPAQNILFLG
jgi:hypothetical protein